MNGRCTAGRLLASLTVISLLSACATGASPTPAPASPTPASQPSVAVATPTETPTPSASAAAASAPRSYGPVTEVKGTATCPTIVLGSPTTGAAGVRRFRNGSVRCTTRTDDPRVSGTHTSATWNADWWGDANLSNGALVQWATARLENAGGAWEGQLSGVYSPPERGDIIAIWYRGTGGYAGLSYFELWTGQAPWTILGLIFPAAPPDLAALPAFAPATPAPTAPASPTAAPSPLPSAVVHGPVSVVTGTLDNTYTSPLNGTSGPGGITRYRDFTFIAADRVNDPRVSGTETEYWNMDGWGTPDNGAALQWGSVRLENAGGAWEGTGSGIFDSRGDTIAIWYEGTGGYAGLAYSELVTSSEPAWKIQGQIFPGDPPTP
jgi:hypothetical protein